MTSRHGVSLRVLREIPKPPLFKRPLLNEDDLILKSPVVDLTLDLCAGVEMPAVSTPRSLDLAHLRAARWFHEDEKLRRFVTLDETQEIAARELGLPT